MERADVARVVESVRRRQGPAPKQLLTITDGEHTLGGIAGEAVKEITDDLA